jgi:predicted transcriptional regulator
MSGERWLKLAGFSALILICTIFLISSTAYADEVEDDGSLVYDLILNQDNDNSWNNSLNVTAYAVYTISLKNEGNEPDAITIGGINWMNENYAADDIEFSVASVKIETQAFIVLPDIDDDGFTDFQKGVAIDLRESQEPDGSWNQDVGDTAIAAYALASDMEENREVVDSGTDWLLDQEDKESHSWGSVEDDSKAILALDSAGYDVWEEIAALMLKQKPDGSFGGIEETSWAVMALSTNPTKESMESMERAVTFLRAQDFESDKDLAMAALAEQYYENTEPIQEGGGGGKGGFIPPPWMYLLSIFIIGALALSYWLFARLDRNEELDGARKDIYRYITDNPGEHLANITKSLDLGLSSVRYHLSVLEGMDKIVCHKNGKYKRYYVNQNGYSKYTNGNGYKHIMSALKNNTARKIVKFLISNPESNQKSVSESLKLHPSTVNWHAKRLRDAEIISKRKNGKEIVYSLNEDVQLRKVIGIIEGSVA